MNVFVFAKKWTSFICVLLTLLVMRIWDNNMCANIIAHILKSISTEHSVYEFEPRIIFVRNMTCTFGTKLIDR
jgi:hypothetical protein